MLPCALLRVRARGPHRRWGGNGFPWPAYDSCSSRWERTFCHLVRVVRTSLERSQWARGRTSMESPQSVSMRASGWVESEHVAKVMLLRMMQRGEGRNHTAAELLDKVSVAW